MVFWLLLQFRSGDHLLLLLVNGAAVEVANPNHPPPRFVSLPVRTPGGSPDPSLKPTVFEPSHSAGSMLLLSNRRAGYLQNKGSLLPQCLPLRGLIHVSGVIVFSFAPFKVK